MTSWISTTSIAGAVIPALLLSALVHGLYDFVAVGAPVAFRPVTAGIILLIWGWRMRTFRRLHEEQGDA